MKRYQYTRLGLRPPTSTRQVQSDAAETGAAAVATTRVNCSSSATSTFSFTTSNLRVAFSTDLSTGGRRVHSRTLLLSGSPDATPSGKRSRRSCHAMLDFDANGPAQAAVAPMAAAICRNERLVTLGIGSFLSYFPGGRLEQKTCSAPMITRFGSSRKSESCGSTVLSVGKQTSGAEPECGEGFEIPLVGAGDRVFFPAFYSETIFSRRVRPDLFYK